MFTNNVSGFAKGTFALGFTGAMGLVGTANCTTTEGNICDSKPVWQCDTYAVKCDDNLTTYVPVTVIGAVDESKARVAAVISLPDMRSSTENPRAKANCGDAYQLYTYEMHT